MAAICETALVDAADDDSEAGALDDLLGLGGALADASDDDNDALVDDAFGRRARGAGASVSGAKGWAVLDDALLPSVAERIRDAAANAVFKPHKFVYDAQTYAKPGVAEVDLAEGTCDDALANDLRGVAEALAPALAVSCGVFDADAAIKIQRNTSGAFACHYDNAGPPSKRSVTAVLYLGRADGAAVAEDDGGALCLAPFLRRRARLRPLFNRLVLFKSDRVLHSVERWRGASPRLCVSFWFEGPVNAPEDLVLTRDRLRFSDWDAAAEFFMSSPVQRTLSRAVNDDDYRSSIRDMRSDGEGAMLAGHARVVDATVKSLKPLVDELRRRRCLVGADLLL
jgi:hypothetical protein